MHQITPHSASVFYTRTKTNACINWVLFDEQFRVVSTNNWNVGAAESVNSLPATAVNVVKNGYLYVYCSNTSNQDVFFDNLQVIHNRGPLTEEEHYYPFGLTMKGISSQAAGSLENKYKLFGKELQHSEFSDGSGLEWYDYGMREYDQQIGRFFRVDPISEKFYELSAYQYCSNDPIKNVDMDGAEGLDFRIFNKLVQNTVQNPNGTSAKVLGAAIGVGGSLTNVMEGALHPGQALKGLGHMMSQSSVQNGAEYATSLAPQYSGSGSDAFTKYAMGAHMLTDLAMVLSPMKEGVFTKEGVLARNTFEGISSINDIGKMGETLTKGVLEKQFKGAEILEQVGIQMDGAKMNADFVVVQNGKVVGVFESKVNGSSLSNGQKLFFNDGEAGTLTGKNAARGNIEGIKVDPSKLQTGVYRWNSQTGSYTVK